MSSSSVGEQGANVVFHDSACGGDPVPSRLAGLQGPEILPAQSRNPCSADEVLVVGYGAVDHQLVKEHAKLVVNTRGVYREADERLAEA